MTLRTPRLVSACLATPKTALAGSGSWCARHQPFTIKTVQTSQMSARLVASFDILADCKELRAVTNILCFPPAFRITETVQKKMIDPRCESTHGKKQKKQKQSLSDNVQVWTDISVRCCWPLLFSALAFPSQVFYLLSVHTREKIATLILFLVLESHTGCSRNPMKKRGRSTWVGF